MNNDIKVLFSSNHNKEYHVVSGSVFNKERSETLDSASIILDNVSNVDRLTNLQPYEYVCIKGLSANNYFMIVDNFIEKKTNILQNIYQYTIDLMSETKFLEKIQCPNLSITHDLDGTRYTILQKVQQYCELYIPKVKMKYRPHWQPLSWRYEPIFTLDTSSDFVNKLSVPCADMSMSNPTLRQVLTNLFLQVGCIPKVENRVIKLLDYRENQNAFVMDNSINYIEKSMSSDSYVNTLVSMSNQVLDSKNEVISETVGFRDRNNVSLKQKENLKLETKFPIYKINELIMHNYCQAQFRYNLCHCSATINDIPPNRGLTELKNFYYRFIARPSGRDTDLEVTHPLTGAGTYLVKTATTTPNVYQLRFQLEIAVPHYVTNAICHLRNTKLHILVKNGNNWEEFNTVNLFNGNTISLATTVTSSSPYSILYSLNDNGVADYANPLDSYYLETNPTRPTCSVYRYVWTQTDINYSKEYAYWLESECVDSQETSDSEVYYWKGEQHVAFLYIPLIKAGYYFPQNNTATYPDTTSVYPTITWNDFVNFDMTKLCIEQTKRSLLSSNFKDMVRAGATKTLDEFAKYRMGTVGYSIGSKEISGFSETYSEIPTGAWWDVEKTYIENITNQLVGLNVSGYYGGFRNVEFKNIDKLNKLMGYQLLLDSEDSVGTTNNPFIYYNHIWFYNPKTGEATSSTNFNYSSMFFDIKYQPINSFNMSYVKNKDIPLPIEQLDGTADGLVDFDRLSYSEQDKINRLGNDILSISQTTDDVTKINDVNTSLTYDGEEYTVFKRSISYENGYLKVNYYASKNYIMQNYFTSISTKYRAYQNVDYSQTILRKEKQIVYVLVSNDEYVNDDKIYLYGSKDFRQLLLSGAFNNSDTDKDTYKLRYNYEKGLADVFNETGERYVVREQANQTCKNDLSVISTNDTISIVYENFDNTSAGVYWYNDTVDMSIGGIAQYWQMWSGDYYIEHEVGYLTGLPVYEQTEMTETGLKKIFKEPIIDSYDITNYKLFNLVDNNDDTELDLNKTFYKDNAEIINQTVQFIYYTDSDRVKWTEWFTQNCLLVGNDEKEVNCVVVTDSLNLNKESHSENNADENVSSYITKVNKGFTVNYNGNNYIKLCHREWNGVSYEYYDVIGFKKEESATDTYYASLNDTKTLKVYDVDSNGLIYLGYKCDKNYPDRRKIVLL